MKLFSLKYSQQHGRFVFYTSQYGAARKSSENVTSCFCNYFSIIQSDCACKLCSNYPGACFSKVPKLFGPISGATIPFISSQHRGSRPSNFAIVLVFLMLKTCEKISFSKQADCSLITNFSGPKSSGDFRETGPWKWIGPSASDIIKTNWNIIICSRHPHNCKTGYFTVWSADLCDEFSFNLFAFKAESGG